MANWGSIAGALVTGRNENSLALANVNFDFALFKIEAPKEFQQLGETLAPWRREAAESGLTHKTARKLGALFEQVAVPVDELFKAYGERVSEIAASEANNPRGSRQHGLFQSRVGADGTTIWAAATSGKTAIAMNLLACMLARLWPASKATSIWSELVKVRKEKIAETCDGSEPSHMAAIAASQQDISRKELAEWDASARAWLAVADKAKLQESQEMETVMGGLSLLVDNSVDVYTSVLRAWQMSLTAMDRLVRGMPQRVSNGAVLIAISAWHIYPDIVMFGSTAKNIVQKDRLVRPGGRLTVGLEDSIPDSGQGVHWSLSLAHLRYYGDPILSTGYSSDESKVPFDDFVLAVLGSLLATWAGENFNANFEKVEAARFIICLWEYLERLPRACLLHGPWLKSGVLTRVGYSDWSRRESAEVRTFWVPKEKAPQNLFSDCRIQQPCYL
ncbi:hypothetical protein GQ53DRAFT_789682 [Thozetella sp. PMI_491]|nr:hypothetical protein GQ53DRAFT_789682 [Thozetella sp. PMI_491]